MDICRAELYLSTSKLTNQEANYATPAKLRIYGGNGYCNKAELLYETAVITNTRWLGHSFRLSPKNGNYQFLFIEAYYKTPVLFPYNGNILLDNASPIKPIICGPEKMPDAKPKPPIAVAKPKVPPSTAKGGNATVKVDTPAKKPDPPKAPVAQLERKAVKKGVIYRLDKVYFDTNKYELREESEAELDKFYGFLRDNPDVVVEVRGHTNNAMWPDSSFAYNLSTNRAKSVADWLVAKGISASRVQYKGYGWKMPVEPNTTAEGRKKNQRVEVKILNMNG
jgi:outer membrane protein OmpA-like peptidoglycan-associated protein